MKDLYCIPHLHSFRYNTLVTVSLNSALPLLTASQDQHAYGYAPTNFHQKWIYSLA